MSDIETDIEDLAQIIAGQALRIEALEAALLEIARWPSSCEEARNIARAALNKDAGK